MFKNKIFLVSREGTTIDSFRKCLEKRPKRFELESSTTK